MAVRMMFVLGELLQRGERDHWSGVLVALIVVPLVCVVFKAGFDTGFFYFLKDLLQLCL